MTASDTPETFSAWFRRQLLMGKMTGALPLDTPEERIITIAEIKVRELQAALAAARVDSARLDWLEMHASVFNDVYLCRYPFASPNQDQRWMMKINCGEEYAATARAAIDAARKDKAVDCKEESP